MTPIPPQAPAPATKPRLRLREKAGYSLGDASINVFNQTAGAFLMIFYTDVFGLSAAAVGTLFFVARMFDAINDPLMGVVADRTRTRHGKFRPYILWMAAPFGLFCFLVFFTPPLGPEGKLAYAYVTYIGIMIILTMIGIPYSSLMGVLSPDPAERSQVSTIRFVAAAAGGLVVQGSTLWLVDLFGGGDEQVGYATTAAIYGGVCTFLLLLTFLWTKERVEPPRSQQQSLRRDLLALLGNRPWFILSLVGILVIVAASIRGGVGAYYFKYYVEDQKVFAAFMVFGTSFYLIGIACTQLLVRFFGGKRRAFAILAAINGLANLAYYFIGPDQFVPMFGFSAVAAFATGPLFPLIWTMYTDVADYGEWKTGRRTTGLVISASSFAQKFGWSFGGSVGGWILGFYGFQPNVAQSPEVIHGILLMMSIFPCAVGLLAAVIVLFYRLDDATLETITEELETRRSNP